MQRCSVRDRSQLGQRVIDEQRGYLTAPAIIGRCGIQTYTRGELKLGGDSNALVRLMRLPEEVFRPETIASFEDKPICDGHPPEGVDASNWRELAIGSMRDVARKPNDLLGARALLMDLDGVKTVIGGKDELSCGYTFDLDLTPGKAPDGQDFDGYQRNILGDHVAIVDSPRGGPICRIGDNQRKERNMIMRKLAVDGLPKFEVDELAADTIEREFSKIAADRDQVLTDLRSALEDGKAKTKASDTKIKELGDAITAKDATIAKLTADLAAARAVDVDALVAERTKVVADAKKLAPDMAISGSNHEIRKSAIAVACADPTSKIVADAVFGASGADKATEAQVLSVFSALVALPGKAASAAQDSRVGAALAGGQVAGSGEAAITLGGSSDYRRNNQAK